jgi:8-oxo-dGTP pyrophosphatase MutT (NUDIX family)
VSKVALAGCIIADKDGGVLVLHRNTPNCVQWEIPGGKLEQGENAAMAAVRELREELGVGVSIDRQLGQRHFMQNDVQFEYTWFLATITSGEPMLMERHAYDKFGFLSLVTLTRRYDELSPNAKNFLEAMAYGEVDLDI